MIVSVFCFVGMPNDCFCLFSPTQKEYLGKTRGLPPTWGGLNSGVCAIKIHDTVKLVTVSEQPKDVLQ